MTTKLDPNQIVIASYTDTLVAGAKASIGGSSVQLTTTSINLSSGVWIKALAGNTNTVYVGTSSGVTTSTGYPLAASESVFIAINDLSKIWFIGGASGQEIRYIGS